MIIFNALQTSLSGGIGRYSYEVAKGIYKLGQVDFKIVIREQDKERFDFARNEDLIIIKNINNSKQRNYVEQFVLPKLIYKKYPDAIIHYPDTMAPIFSKNKVVITIHDLAFKTLKNEFTFKTRLWKNFITDLSVKKADKIIAITNFTKSEIEKYYPYAKNKTTVIYNGFNDFSQEPINEKKLRNGFNEIISNPYILTVSTISPRKNIDGLIKAFNLLKEQIPHNLIIAGKNGWNYEYVFRLVDELKLNDRVWFTGAVTDDELKLLYKNASLFVYPSYYEGFGLPPLEAMACGCPTIVLNESSLPEVVGKGALLVYSSDEDELSKKIKFLLYNDIYRNYIINEGLDNVKRFSWIETAKKIIEIYK
ncbi:glycosyltransferase family 4 protein [Clostridium thermopalmarium]|uniref:Mannosylfructose-phosphate synthase n=1 Tax=Clostridium thermopalmarium DSM 5974 TaxID=1121340 RepID=A0A2T0AZ94_9CLOT|nr:glycosyltransferase family 1 protein [Clostridium thermopalmarium]PRR76510.1 Mannosylfructose-phosphate synthase [Clostridium thermopalmarium DSM 5974]PVZ28377.1 glycosyltransferase involved in cell wall biosynthesis [Clostridium thermopalmarium DSM 5974]